MREGFITRCLLTLVLGPEPATRHSGLHLLAPGFSFSLSSSSSKQCLDWKDVWVCFWSQLSWLGSSLVRWLVGLLAHWFVGFLAC